jgi:octaprenyl-diphosphate synthase
VHEANAGPAEDIERMRKFGELVGLAFQIKDDLLDLGEGERIGKPTGGDIRERKMTLPLIHTLQTASASERRRIIRLVKYRNNDNAAVQEVMDAIINGPGMDYARRKMRGLSEEALELLGAYPDSDSKAALTELVEYTMNRKR